MFKFTTLQSIIKFKDKIPNVFSIKSIILNEVTKSKILFNHIYFKPT